MEFQLINGKIVKMVDFPEDHTGARFCPSLGIVSGYLVQDDQGLEHVVPSLEGWDTSDYAVQPEFKKYFESGYVDLTGDWVPSQSGYHTVYTEISKFIEILKGEFQ